MSSTYLGFDFGMKRIGVAVGQTVTKTATPLSTLAANKGEPDWQLIAALIKEWRVDGFIVGVPLKMDGSTQFTTHAAQQFAEQLKQRFDKPVHEVDERLSTKIIRQQVFEEGGYKALQKAAIDSLVAKLIVEDWMRHHE